MLIAIFAVGALLIYFFVLPGGGAVKANVGVSPGLPFFAVARLGAVFAELIRLFERQQPVIALLAWLAGAIAIATISVSAIGRWRRRETFSELETFALALFVFGFTANVLIAGSRSSYFFEHTVELFAGRYLVWSCVAWSGFTIYALAQATRADLAWRYAVSGGIMALSILALPSAVWANYWSASMYRMTELAAVAEQSMSRSDSGLAAISDEGLVTTSRSLDEMRKRKLAMFAERNMLRLGAKVKMSDPSSTVAAKITHVAVSGSPGKTVRLLSGWLPDKSFVQLRSSELWLVGRDGMLIGRASITMGAPTNAALLGVPDRIRFEGYVPESDANEIALAVARDGGVSPIARLELQP